VTDLLVDVHTPALGRGRAMRTYTVARALALAGGGLRLLYVRFGADEPDAAFRSIPGIELHEVRPSRGVRRAAAYLAARAHGVPRDLARAVSPELAAAARELAARADTTRVIADGPSTAAALAPLARARDVVYNAHNLESGFRHELAGERLGRGGALAAFERGLLARSSESWMVSEADLRSARELCPTARLRLVPNAVDVDAITPVTVPRSERAVLVASFDYPPNADGLRFLADEVLPLVWRELPAAGLALAGPGLDRAPTDPRIEALGFVPDLASVYATAACAVVPLRTGGGTPLKLIEALAYGVPVVATSRAVAGLDVVPGEHCLVADGAGPFAQAVLRALRGDVEGLAERGRALVRDRYSVESLAALLRN